MIKAYFRGIKFYNKMNLLYKLMEFSRKNSRKGLISEERTVARISENFTCAMLKMPASLLCLPAQNCMFSVWKTYGSVLENL